jgi:hypothetical protein
MGIGKNGCPPTRARPQLSKGEQVLGLFVGAVVRASESVYHASKGDAVRPLRKRFDKDNNTGVLAQTAIPFGPSLGYTHDAEFARHAIGRRLVGWSEVGTTLTGEFVKQIVLFDTEEYHDIPLHTDNQFTIAILSRKARITTLFVMPN